MGFARSGALFRNAPCRLTLTLLHAVPKILCDDLKRWHKVEAVAARYPEAAEIKFLIEDAGSLRPITTDCRQSARSAERLRLLLDLQP